MSSVIPLFTFDTSLLHFSHQTLHLVTALVFTSRKILHQWLLTGFHSTVNSTIDLAQILYYLQNVGAGQKLLMKMYWQWQSTAQSAVLCAGYKIFNNCPWGRLNCYWTAKCIVDKRCVLKCFLPFNRPCQNHFWNANGSRAAFNLPLSMLWIHI